MTRQKLAVPATLFAAGVFAAPAQAAQSVDYTASVEGTPIDIVGSSEPEYLFWANPPIDVPTEATFSTLALADFAPGTTFSLGKPEIFSGNSVGEVSPTPYYPTDPSSTVKVRGDLTDGYYGLLFGDGTSSTQYTGYALVDRGGSHISEIDFRVLPAAAVPEPETWALMILGFGLAAGALRRRASPSPALQAA